MVTCRQLGRGRQVMMRISPLGHPHSLLVAQEPDGAKRKVGADTISYSQKHLERWGFLWFLVSCLWSVVRGQLSVVSGPWSVVLGPWLVVRGQLSVVRG